MSFWKPRKSSPVFQGPDQHDPESFLRSFCSDYKKWNDYCVQVSDTTKPQIAKLSELYSSFLNSYIAEGVELQLIAFGTIATFDPDRLAFGHAEINDKKIKKYFSIISTHGDYSEKYFAELLETVTGCLKLVQVFYVDPFPEDYAVEQEPVLPCL